LPKLAKQGNLFLSTTFCRLTCSLQGAHIYALRRALGTRFYWNPLRAAKIARYTFAGAHPEEVFRYANGACVLESHDRVIWEERTLFLSARALQRFRPCVSLDCRVIAGAIGYSATNMASD